MKSDLDARPVYARTRESIQGHFLICYLTVLLERLFQFKILKNKYSSSEIFKLLKGFKVVKTDGKFINTTKYSELLEYLSNAFSLPLTNYYFSKTQINSILNISFNTLKKELI